MKLVAYLVRKNNYNIEFQTFKTIEKFNKWIESKNNKLAELGFIRSEIYSVESGDRINVKYIKKSAPSAPIGAA